MTKAPHLYLHTIYYLALKLGGQITRKHGVIYIKTVSMYGGFPTIRGYKLINGVYDFVGYCGENGSKWSIL